MTAFDGQECQICGDNVGKTVNGETFMACDVCALPVCRPCYEYERKHGNQCCPQCKTRYKRHKGSPAILGDREENVGADDGANEFNYDSENQSQKQKISERMLSWHMTYGRADEVGAPNYDKEVSHNHIPMLTSGQEVSGELSAASPERLSMASPEVGGRKRVHNLPYSSDINQSPNRVVDPGLGNVAWKERVDGWKMKQEKNVVPMSTGQAASERGAGDIDASTDVLVDDSLFPVLTPWTPCHLSPVAQTSAILRCGSELRSPPDTFPLFPAPPPNQMPSLFCRSDLRRPPPWVWKPQGSGDAFARRLEARQMARWICGDWDDADDAWFVVLTRWRLGCPRWRSWWSGLR